MNGRFSGKTISYALQHFGEYIILRWFFNAYDRKVRKEENALKNRPGTSREGEDYDDYQDMDHPRGRLPHEEEADLYSVPDSAGGDGYRGVESTERWLDDIKIEEGQCVLYRGEACRSYLSGRHIRITSRNREDMYDVDRNLRAAVLFINSSTQVRPQCRSISHAVACLHMYKVCDPEDTSRTLTICKDDCDKLTTEKCASEMVDAATHNLIGDHPQALFPSCSLLPPSSNCIPILQSPQPPPTGVRMEDWCYSDNGSSYRGTESETKSGRKCREWTEHAGREYSLALYPHLRESANYCRNPGGKKSAPWCYAGALGQEEYCNIPICPPGIGDRVETPSGSGITGGAGLASFWLGLSPTVQISILGGGGLLAILFLSLLCLCCCRRKGASNEKNRSPPTHSLPNTLHSAPHSVLNTTYYRKLNGTSTPMTSRGMEMGSMMSGGNRQVLFNDSQTFHVLEIPASEIQGVRQMGEGRLGEVLDSAVWTNSPTGPVQIAVKTSRGEDVTVRGTLEEEVKRVASLSHPNLLSLLGVSFIDGHLFSAVYDYSVNGSLLKLCQLRASSEERERDNHMHDFLSLSLQVCAGMEYLSSQGIVHRDLSARNVLIAEGMHAKISDLASMMPEYDDHYVSMSPRSWLPIRWLAKEALESGRYSEKSDVWSYGVTIWEVFSYGKLPYDGYSNQEVLQLVATRQLLESPLHSPTNMYSMMVECWHEMAERRPSFCELHRRLQSWSALSPPHSILHSVRASSSSHSGSSSGTRPRPLIPSNPQFPPSNRRPPLHSSPLINNEPVYGYTDDDAESD